MNWGNRSVALRNPGHPASPPTPTDHCDFAENPEAPGQTRPAAWLPQRESPLPLPGPMPRGALFRAHTDSRGLAVSWRQQQFLSQPQVHSAGPALEPEGFGQLSRTGRVASAERTLSRYEAARGGGSPHQAQAARGGFQGCLGHLWPPRTPLPCPPAFLCSSHAGLHQALGLRTCWLILLSWERCLLYPQLKVEKHPASSVQSPGGGDFLASPEAGTPLGWAGLGAAREMGICRRGRCSSRPGHPAAAHTGTGSSHALPARRPRCSPRVTRLQPQHLTLPSALRPAPAQQQQHCGHRDGGVVGLQGGYGRPV